MSVAAFVYIIAAFFPFGPEWARGFYLSVAAGLLGSSLVIVVNGVIGPPPKPGS
ncbi:MAG TPA: hypothetical protein VEL81_01380 [Thermoplasmata archaeon]|nr:hypothetical protein [Thermoplasmata archaeon]